MSAAAISSVARLGSRADPILPSQFAYRASIRLLGSALHVLDQSIGPGSAARAGRDPSVGYVLSPTKSRSSCTSRRSGTAVRLRTSPSATTSDVKSKIEDAFRRHAQLDADTIQVSLDDGTLILTGEVYTLRERSDAELAAWATRGVTTVENRIRVHM